MSPKSAVLGAQ